MSMIIPKDHLYLTQIRFSERYIGCMKPLLLLNLDMFSIDSKSPLSHITVYTIIAQVTLNVAKLSAATRPIKNSNRNELMNLITKKHSNWI